MKTGSLSSASGMPPGVMDSSVSDTMLITGADNSVPPRMREPVTTTASAMGGSAST